jgi:hypothetical protein
VFVFVYIYEGDNVMKRYPLLFGILFILTGFISPAYPWGAAIHAYIGERLDDRGILKANVVYGGMAADTFNFMFDTPEQMQYLYAVTHGFPPFGLDTVLPVLRLAKTEREKAVAFGFVTHNNVNGADATAHGVPYNSPDGYVIKKALELNDILKPLLEQNGISLPDPVLLEVSHTLVEYAADLLIRKYDRSIGASIISSAITRDEGFPALLAEAYAQGFADTFGLSKESAIFTIISEEAKFRRMMIYYGTILQFGDHKAQDEVAKFLTEMTPAFLKPYGIEIPYEALLPITQFGIAQALELCKDDLLPAVQATIELIKINLADCRDGDC